MKNIFKLLFLIILCSVVFAACEKEEGLHELLELWVPPSIQQTSDITVGAYYYPVFSDTNWMIGQFHEPDIGLYNSEEVSVVEQHIDYSKQAGVDVWLYSWGGMESRGDTILQEVLPMANGINDVQISIVFEHGAVTETGPIDLSLETDKLKMIEAFVYLKPVFERSNYFKIDGKPVVVIRSGTGYQPQPDQLIAGDPDLRPAAFDEVRNEVNLQSGMDLYLIGDVVDWYPPERFPEYLATFDAITPYNMHTNSKQVNTRFNESVDLSYEHWTEYTDANGHLFIPNAIPGYNDTIQETRNNDVLPRGEQFFREQCNISKKYLNPGLNLVFVTSFNQWHEDTQIEPSPTYGNIYLDILKGEFKL